MGSSGNSSFKVRLIRKEAKGWAFLVGELGSNGSSSLEVEEITLDGEGFGGFGHGACSDSMVRLLRLVTLLKENYESEA